MVRLALIILLLLILFALLPAWPYSAGWGYYPSGGLGLIWLIGILVLLFGNAASGGFDRTSRALAGSAPGAAAFAVLGFATTTFSYRQ